MSYQKITGPLMANTHPGSYSGQDAYNDMFVTEKKNERVHRERTGRPVKTEQESWDIELYARSADDNPGGGDGKDYRKKAHTIGM